MPFTSGPYSPVAGEPFNATNPAVTTGALTTQAVVITNVSPYLLNVATGAGKTSAIVSPYTTDEVTLSPTAGQTLTITPIDLGLTAVASLPPVIYATWYSSAETVAGSYPYALPIISIVNDSTTPIPVVSVAATAYASLTGPGETAAPGDLTQEGGFTVNDVDGHGVTLKTIGDTITLMDNGDESLSLGAGTAALYGDVIVIGDFGAMVYVGYPGNLPSDIALNAGNAVGIDAGGTIEIKSTFNSPPQPAIILSATAAGSGIQIGATDAEAIGFFGLSPCVTQGAIVGEISAVTDPNARAVLASIANQLDRINLILNGTS